MSEPSLEEKLEALTAPIEYKSLVLRRMGNGQILPFVDGVPLAGMMNCQVACDGNYSLATLTFNMASIGFDTAQADLSTLN